MAFDGNGVYTPASPQYPAISGTIIYASDFNAVISDIATALSLCVTKDGQQVLTANIPMAGFKLTGLGAGAIAGDSLRYEQVFIGSPIFPLPQALASPADGDNSLLLATTAWVQARIVEPIYATDVIPGADYSQRLATTKYVTDKAIPQIAVPTINLLILDQWS